MERAWQNVSDAIFHFAQDRPDAPAVIDGGSTLNYSQLATLVGKAAVHLRDIGISAGDRIGVALSNSADHLVLSVALMRIGAVTVELSPAAPPAEATGLCRKFDVGTLFIEADAEPPKGLSTIRFDLGWRELIERKSGDFRHEGGDEDFYSITLTSGSTGQPKGVVTPHSQRLARFNASLKTFRDKEVWSEAKPGTFLMTAGFNFAGFFQFLHNQLFVGGPVVLLPEMPRSTDLIRMLASWDDVIAVVTPTICRALIACAPSRGLLFPRMRALIALGLPMYTAEKRTMLNRITPKFYDHYGTTAFGVISCLHPEDMAAKGDSVGRVAAATEVEIVDSAGNRKPNGQIGHLRCRGPSMSTGFYGDDAGPATTPEGFRDGWYFPGDLGLVDDAGFVFLKGRVSDLILRRGIEIMPPEVEEVLANHPSVAHVAVIGRPLPTGDQEMVAFVVPRGEPKHEELVTHCRAWLAPDRQPDRIHYTDTLPVTGVGKIDRAQLKAQAMRGDHQGRGRQPRPQAG